MKKLKKAWHRIPRKARVLIQFILLLLTAMVFYISIGSPAFGIIHSFRRAEKTQCVGPSKILGILELENARCDRVLLAEDSQGTYMYLYWNDSHTGNLHYRKKSADPAVIAVPLYDSTMGLKSIELPVIAFDNHPEAVYAKLSVTVSALSISRTYTVEAHRERDGYFCFWIKEVGWPVQIEALEALSGMGSSRPFSSFSQYDFPATIQLFDKNDKLIQTEHLTLRSPAGEANAAEGQVQP